VKKGQVNWPLSLMVLGETSQGIEVTLCGRTQSKSSIGVNNGMCFYAKNIANRPEGKNFFKRNENNNKVPIRGQPLGGRELVVNL